MTDEQQERVNQIREQRREAAKLSWMDHPPQPTWKDIDFLLNLVDSQVAERPFGWISCGLRNGNDRIVDIVFENADCAKAFIDRVVPVDGPIVIAASMRSVCIEKVKEMRQDYADEWDLGTDDEKLGYKAMMNAADDILRGL